MSDLVQHLETRKGENLYVQAKFVVDTLNRYMSSADELITTAHVPYRMMDKNGCLVPIQHAVRMVRYSMCSITAKDLKLFRNNDELNNSDYYKFDDRDTK